MAKKSRPKSLIPTSVPIAVLALMIAGFWIVRPREIAVAEQNLNTGNPAESLRILERLRAKAEYPIDPNIPRVELRLAKEQFNRLSPEDQRRFWIAMFERRLTGELDADATPTLAMLALSMSSPAGLSVEFRQPLSRPENELIAEALITRELGEGRPELAAELLAATLTGREEVDVARYIRLADIRLQAGKVDAALQGLDAIPDHLRTPASAELRIRLLRATGDNRRAANRIAAFLDERGERVSYDELAQLIAVAREGSEFEAPLKTLARFVDERPYDTRLRHGYSTLLADARRPEEAARQLAYALGPDPIDIPMLRRLVMLKEWASDISGAQNARVRLATLGEPGMIEALHETSMSPDDLHTVDVLYKTLITPGREKDLVIGAEFFAWMGRYDEAVALYRLHLRNNPQDKVALRSLTIMKEELGDIDAALVTAKQLVELDPNHFENRDIYARLLLASGRRREALEQLSEASKRGAGEALIEKEIALASSLGNHKAAADATRRLIASKKESAQTYDLLRHALYARESGDFETAEQSLHRILKNDPANDDARRDLALTLSGRGNYPDALDALREHRGIKTDPDLAALYMDLMRLNNATSLERQYIDPAPPETLLSTRPLQLRLAALYAGVNRTSESLAVYARLHDEKPGDLDILEPYLLALIEANRRGEALELARIHISPTDAKSLRVRGRVFAEANKFGEAREALRELVKLPGHDTEPNLSMLGDVELAAGNLTRARQAYAAALRRLLGKNLESKSPAR